MDDDTAKYLSESLALALAENKVKTSATGSFVATLFMWLALSFAVYLKERAEKNPSGSPPERGNPFQEAKNWLTEKVTGRTMKTIQQQVAQAPAPPVEEAPTPPPTGPIIQRAPTIHPQSQKVRYLDLEEMSRQSEMETNKLKMEMAKRKEKKGPAQSPVDIAPSSASPEAERPSSPPSSTSESSADAS